ncbi:Hypothetical predicted protein [Prunus dulcis]|uniref:Uncharacterized protein n=1 Tax=Prunus dulcis TaxID=3755 RepID=A0A5E4E340_PRUDU|nr:Hypothetical predicted protein [Prunus dulcis]
MVHATFTLSGLLNFMDVVKVTPAEICEEVLKKNDEDEDDDDDAALERVVDLLKLEGTNSIEKTEMQAEKRF